MNKNYTLAIIAIFAILALGGIYAIFAKSKTPSIVPGQNTTVDTISPTAALMTPVDNALALEISQPADKAVVRQSLVKVVGKTVAGAEVTVNDTELKADSKGNFSANVSLDEGENTIIIVANDADGNFAEKELTVIFEPENQ